MNSNVILFFIFVSISLIVWLIALIYTIRINKIICPYRKEIKEYYKLLGLNYYETSSIKRKKIFIEWLKYADEDIVKNKDEILKNIQLLKKRILILELIFIVCILTSTLFTL